MLLRSCSLFLTDSMLWVKVEIEAGKLMRKLEKDGNEGITFDEFVAYFELKSKQAQKFAAAVAKKKAKEGR